VHLRGITRALACAAIAFTSAFASANPPAADRGVAWLSLQTQANGSIAGEAASIATAFQARSETLATLRQLSTALTTLADLTARRISPDQATAIGNKCGRLGLFAEAFAFGQ
jgi:hypothetical protein